MISFCNSFFLFILNIFFSQLVIFFDKLLDWLFYKATIIILISRLLVNCNYIYRNEIKLNYLIKSDSITKISKVKLNIIEIIIAKINIASIY